MIARTLQRQLEPCLIYLIDHYPAVALLRPRQVGRTTLALEVPTDRPSRCLDLESPSDRARLADPEQCFADQTTGPAAHQGTVQTAAADWPLADTARQLENAVSIALLNARTHKIASS